MNKYLTILLTGAIMAFGFGRGETSGPSEGQNAIDFELRDQDGNLTKLSDFKGQMVVVYFFPKAHTPG